MAGIRTSKGGHTIWQRWFWEHTIRDEQDLQHHVDYVRYNPVKHGLVDRLADWPFPSFHRYVKAGLLSVDWASSPQQRPGGYGERYVSRTTLRSTHATLAKSNFAY